MKHTALLLLMMFSGLVLSQDQLEIIDVKEYGIYLDVNDSNDIINVSEVVYIEFKEDCEAFYLDLKSLGEDSKGMVINNASGMIESDTKIDYDHRNDSLIIYPKQGNKGTSQIYKFEYSGIPQNGLIIGKNKFEDRTFFGDNWPNRAHHWIACVDHPADKAEITFAVEAPQHYDCIATGEFIRTSELVDGRYVHYYKSKIQLPTKVMVVGLAEFSVEKLIHPNDFPLTVWVYEKDAMNGFRDMAVARDVVTYFIKQIGTYPYEKLANVQSTTMFGGMENAGNIFYDENAITGEKKMEALIAHEIAHQWFGNSASESDWQHLWLSEGFATYFTNLYYEDTHGDEAFKQRLTNERQKVISFAKQYNHPVIDTSYAELMHLLNPNSYQKGAWFLHMLRNKIGDRYFFEGIRVYYNQYKYGNASTDDFMHIIEEVSDEKLEDFFTQWLRTSGHPLLKFNSFKKKDKYTLEVEQIQNHFTFEFPLEIQIEFEDGSFETHTFDVKHASHDFSFKTEKKVSNYIIDPNVKLLYEEIE